MWAATAADPAVGWPLAAAGASLSCWWGAAALRTADRRFVRRSAERRPDRGRLWLATAALIGVTAAGLFAGKWFQETILWPRVHSGAWGGTTYWIACEAVRLALIHVPAAWVCWGYLRGGAEPRRTVAAAGAAFVWLLGLGAATAGLWAIAFLTVR